MTRRLEKLDYEQMTTGQKRVHDKIVSGPRGRAGGPFNILLRSPELADRTQNLGAFCRYGTSLPPRLSELAILMVGRHWRAQVEWFVHSRIAAEEGISPDVIEAIRTGAEPRFGRDDERVLHAFARELLEDRDVSDITYAEALEMFGERTLVELVGVIGYYSCIALQLVGFREPTADGSEPLPPREAAMEPGETR